jgi:hypothetical protein
MIVLLAKLQVEHKGRLLVPQWEIETTGGAQRLVTTTVLLPAYALDSDQRRQSVSTPCAFPLRPPCPPDQQLGGV